MLLERDAPEELKRAIRIGSQANNGAAGMFEQDDVDNWRQVTESSISRFSRAVAAGSVDGGWACGAASGLSGAGVGTVYFGEQSAAVLYALGAVHERGSWADIPLDPIQARFEGTATMQG